MQIEEMTVKLIKNKVNKIYMTYKSKKFTFKI